jgi:K+-sensing histidine kinase KdpD
MARASMRNTSPRLSRCPVVQLFQTPDPRDKVNGTGVGLALVKKIVEAEDGEIWLESTLGSGATFHFTLPAAATRNEQRTTNNHPSGVRDECQGTHIAGGG